MPKARVLRSGDVVVRGGVKRAYELVAADIEEAIDQGYGPVLSVFVDRASGTDSYDDTLYRICDDADIPNKQIQVTTVGDLEAIGLKPVPHVEGSWAETHCHVTFDDPVSQSQVEAFIAAFDGPMPNPTGGKKAK